MTKREVRKEVEFTLHRYLEGDIDRNMTSTEVHELRSALDGTLLMLALDIAEKGLEDDTRR